MKINKILPLSNQNYIKVKRCYKQKIQKGIMNINNEPDNKQDFKDLFIFLNKASSVKEREPLNKEIKSEKLTKKIKHGQMFRIKNIENTIMGKFVERFSNKMDIPKEKEGIVLNSNYRKDNTPIALPTVSNNQTCKNDTFISKNNEMIRSFPNITKERTRNNYEADQNEACFDKFSVNFNKELGRISYSYGKESTVNKFSENKKSIHYYNDTNDYYAYKLKVIKSDKCKLLPLHITKAKPFERLSKKIFEMSRDKLLQND